TGPLCSCKHFGALCYLIEESCRLKLTSVSEPRSCTDSLQTWHHPRQKRKSDCFHPMDSIKFIKNEYGKVKQNPSSCYDPRPTQYQQTTYNDIESLQNHLKRLSTPVALLDVIPFHEAPLCESASVSANLPLVPQSSQLRIQAAIRNEPQPLSLQCLFSHAKLFLNMITVSAEDALKIESCTREQTLTPRWYHERKCRLTSSNFGTFCKGAITTAKVKTLLYKESSKLSNTAIMWGKLHESTAFDQYQSIHSSKSGLILRKSGIFISSEDGFLAASPDGILHNNENKCGLLDIKCPYSCRNLTVIEACNQVKAFSCEVVNNEIHLKKSHDYYY
uniref:YqaJ viral recombinase domain-containing protein n=2 Tax=Amphimedon queenslandica TaxID=400682 RepID=A0A1X7VDB0_AMPQE